MWRFWLRTSRGDSELRVAAECGGELARDFIGLFNVAGSVGAGLLGQRYRMKYLLALIYAARALMIAIYLVMPKTALNIYIFAAGMGMTWLATVPPTSGLWESFMVCGISVRSWINPRVSPDSERF